MKRILTILVAMAAFLAAENTADAQLLKKLLGGKSETAATETVSTAASDGQAAGAALKALYNQYKADGKIDMGNLKNLMNLTTLATNVQGLKGQSDKSAFYMDFAKGLIMGSSNLVTESNSSSVMSGLASLVNNVDLSGLTASAEEKAGAAAENATEIAGAVTDILNLFKK